MIKKIKSSLSIKVFILTAVLMAACCAVTYSCTARFAPYIYTHDFSAIEEEFPFVVEEISRFTKEEALLSIEDYSGRVEDENDDEFVFCIFNCNSEELKQYNKNDTSKWCRLTFADSTEEYTVFFAKNTEKESQIVEALQKSIPVLAVIIIIVSVIAGFFYTVYMTTPIKRISKISKQMAALDFSGHSESQRTDEIGILSGSLNELSDKLSSALSELQNANKKLQADIYKERELERQRIDFFSAASHELKTPITIIKGQLQGMLCGVGRYKDRDTYLAESLKVTNTLEQMVQELLTVSRLESSGYACTKSRFDFTVLVNDRLSAFDDLLAGKELILEKRLEPETYLMGDRGLLQKVIDNLISNAVTYSPPGSTVTVCLLKSTAGIFFTAENSGAQIPEDTIPKLFEAFYRVDQSRNRRTGGSGLGLYIVKTILDLHEAEIEISNSQIGVMVKVFFRSE